MSERDLFNVLFSFPNVSAMASVLGIHRTTLQRYKEHPESAPFEILEKLARLQGFRWEIRSKERSYTV